MGEMMTKLEHIEHVKYLETLDGFIIPKLEGAFYFGEGVTLAEHISLYKKEIEGLSSKASN